MARISVITVPEGDDYDEALDLLNALISLGDQTRPTLNGTRLVDGEGRVWFGYDYDGASWWITRSMAAPGASEPYEIHEQKDF